MPYQVPDPIPNDEELQPSQRASWPSLEVEGTRYGFSRAEIRNILTQRFPQGASNEQARRFLEEEFDLAGYQQYKHTLVGQEAQHPMSIAQWQSLPEHLRLRRMGQRHVSQLSEEERQHFTQRKGEAYAFPTSALTRGSHLGLGPQGETLSTFGPGKLLKRTSGGI